MALKDSNLPKGKGVGQQDPIEPNTYPARLVQVIDLGLQPRTKWQSDEIIYTNDIWLTFELVTEFCKDDDGNDMEDKPRWVSDRKPWYGLRSENATTTKWYKTLDPTNEFGGDWGALIGAPCLITVVNNPGKGKNAGKIFDNVAAVNPPMKGFPIPELINESKTLDLDEPDMEVFEGLPEFLQKIIKEGKDFNLTTLGGMLGGAPVEQEEKVEEEPTENPF